MKKVVSLLLSIVTIIGIVSSEINAYASGWLDNVQNLEFDTNYSMCWIGTNMSVDYDAFQFSVPSYGTVNLNISSENVYYISSWYTNEFTSYYIYSSNDLNNYLVKWNYQNEDSRGYNSALGEYYENYSNTLSAGDYYLVVKYKFDIYGNNVSGDTYELQLSYKPIFSNTSISKLQARKKAFRVLWNKASNVTGYQIQYSTKKNFKDSKIINVAGASTAGKKVKKLKAKTKYYVRVRTYKIVNVNGKNKTYYGKWSSKKTVKTKK